MRPRIPILALAALLACALAPFAPGDASGSGREGGRRRHAIGPAPAIPAVAAPGAVREGERYETALPELPAGVDECELFLLPDDGSGRMIQLTPERELEEGPLRWTMPRVHAKSARLVLRAGGRFGETEAPPSAPMAIEPEAAPARTEVLRGEAEIAWHFGAGVAAPAASLAAGATRLEFAVPARLTAVASDGPAAEPPARTRDGEAGVAQRGSPDPSAPHPSRRPAFVPLRN